ncbi:MAG: hypothetical protein DCC55_19340 [Chloroflexi bacterium]|nr:MAG: hypothetical protein DCC55_19340 [Chloroflexota bacterium]
MREISVRDRNIAFLIFGVLLASYLLTYTGLIDSSDGLSMFATTESMVRRGELDSNQLLWMGLQQGSFGPNGDLYSRKGIGMALLAYPLVRLAQSWQALGLVQAALLLNPLLTAWTGALLYRMGRRLDWRLVTAAATALIFGLATMAWPYTQGFFSDPVCGWALFAALYTLVAHQQTGRKRYLLAGGAAWGIAYLARTINLVTLPIFLLGLWAVLRERDNARDLPVANLQTFFQRHWRPIVTFLTPVVLAGLVSLWWNWARFGSLWDSGYVESESFSGSWLAGLFGLTIGPARGLLWYNPILLLGVVGAAWFWREIRWLLGVVAALTVVYLLVYSKWYMWHGGYSWGPRFLVPLVPLLALLVGPAWEQIVRRRAWGWAGLGGALLLLALSVAVQVLGLVVPFSLVQEWLAENYTPLFAPETFLQPALSPLFLQWDFLHPEQIHLAWYRGRQVDWSALLATIASALLGLVLLARSLRGAHEMGVREPPRTNWLYGLFLCVVAVALLVRYGDKLTDTEQFALARRIAQAEQIGDGILMLQPEQTQQFANVYHGWLPTYGLAPAGTLGDDARTWLDRIMRAHARLWVVPDETAPESSGWERALRTDHFLLQETRLPDSDGARLALYASANSVSLVESGLGTVFGDPELAEQGINAENGWIRLNGYALNPESTPGGAILLALRWQSIQAVTNDYQVFVHLLDAYDEKIAQRDGQPVQWMRPTSSWQPGEEIIDHYGLLLPNDIPTGEYTIAVGLYNPVTGQRLPISAGPGDYAIELGPILVNRG